MGRILFAVILTALALSSGMAQADVITTFNVSGTVILPAPSQFFSGTLQVDVTTGTIDGVDITFPGLPTFDTLATSGALPPGQLAIPAWQITVQDNTNPGLSDLLTLDFSTAVPDSLIGFNGGTILGNDVVSPTGAVLRADLSGAITPAPEPSALILLAGSLALLGFGRSLSWRNP
jgi:hypothetical protein